MVKINFKSIIDESVKEVSDMPVGMRGRFLTRFVTEDDVTPEQVERILLDKVWGKAIGMLNSQCPATEPMAVEKAIALLVKKKAVRERIDFRKNSFRLELANGRYRAYKHAATGIVTACPWPAERQHPVEISGECFANFLLRFDAVVPEILALVPGIIAARKQQALEEKKRKMEKDLKEQALASLIRQYLEPLGLDVMYEVGDDGMVTMDVMRTLTARFELPLDQMMEQIKNITPDMIH